MSLPDRIYRLEGGIARRAMRLLRLRPSSAPYVSGDSFRALANHVMEEGSDFDPAMVARGNLLFVAAHELARFRSEALPSIHQGFVLVTHNSDMNIGQEESSLADDPRVLRWFAQNLACKHPKIECLPIGLENRRRHNYGITDDFDALRRSSREKRPRILFGFSVGTNPKERRPALEALRRCAAADEFSQANSRFYRRRLCEYAFVASPPGNGLDCHRTWEALYLGVVPIVKHSAFYEGFPGLPALFVDDWSELELWNEEKLMSVYERLVPSIARFEGLWMHFWEGRIRAAQERVR